MDDNTNTNEQEPPKDLVEWRLSSLEGRVEKVEHISIRHEVEIGVIKAGGDNSSIMSFLDNLSLVDWFKLIILIFGLVGGSTAIVEYLGWGEGIDEQTKQDLIKILEDD